VSRGRRGYRRDPVSVRQGCSDRRARDERSHKAPFRFFLLFTSPQVKATEWMGDLTDYEASISRVGEPLSVAHPDASQHVDDVGQSSPRSSPFAKEARRSPVGPSRGSEHGRRSSPAHGLSVSRRAQRSATSSIVGLVPCAQAIYRTDAVRTQTRGCRQDQSSCLRTGPNALWLDSIPRRPDPTD